MPRTFWKRITGKIPELEERLFEIKEEHPQWQIQRICEKLNQEFKKKLTGVSIKGWDGKISLNQVRAKLSELKSRKVVNNLTDKEETLLKRLKKSSEDLATVSDEILDIPKEEIFPFLDNLRAKGFDVDVEQGRVFLHREPTPGRPISILPPITRSTVKILVLSDVGLGLKTQQGRLLATAYKIGEKEGVYFAVIAGNLIAGKPTQKKRGEYFLTEFSEQVNYTVNHLPKPTFKSYFINAFRELSFKSEKGRNIGEVIAEQRDDLRYCGDEKATFEIGKKKIKIAFLHAGSRYAYTKSYPLQGIGENLQEAGVYVFEHSEPTQLVLVGGLYSAIYIPRRLPIKEGRMNDFGKVAIPALHRLTPSQTTRRRRGGSPVLGCMIVTLKFDKEGNLESLPRCDFRNLTDYYKASDYLEDVKLDSNLTPVEVAILKLLKQKKQRAGELSRSLRVSIKHIKKVIETLKTKKDYDIRFDKAQKSFELKRPLKKEFKPLDLEKLYVKKVKVLATGDLHLGNKSERPDLVKKSYSIARKKKVNAIIIPGDVFDGEDAFRGQRRELIFHGADAQRDHGLEIWPKSKIPTYLIRGTSHEKVYWDRAGHDIVDTFVRMAKAEKGANLKYLGEHQGTVKVKGIKLHLIHPRGGIPFGLSYRPQRKIESLVSVMELNKDAKTFFSGHLHVSIFMLYKDVAGFLVPCLEEITEYLSSRENIPWLGVWVAEIAFDELGNITRVVPEYVPFEPKRKI